jgi:hypothetical protein
MCSTIVVIGGRIRYNYAVEAYRRETRSIIDFFQRGILTFPACISALDDAFAQLMPRLVGVQVAPLRALMLANNEAVMKEMERRGPPNIGVQI